MSTQSRTGQVTVNSAQLPYEMAGEGSTIVLIHAGIADSRMWDDQWQEFSQSYRVVRYDARGYGMSTNPDGEFGHDEDLQAILHEVGVERATFVAASMGGQIALNYILQHPERAEGLVLVGSSVDTTKPTEAMKEAWRAVNTASEAGDIAGANEIEMQLWIDGPTRAPGVVDARVRERVSDMNSNALAAYNENATERDIDPPISTRLGEISVPALVIVGDLDQPMMLESADIFVRDIPNAHKAVIEGTAHLPSMERPTEFNALVLDFLHNIHNSSTRS